MNNMVEVRYFAAARAAAGVDNAHFKPAPLTSIIAEACSNNPALANVITQCSFLIDSVVVHDENSQINSGSVVDVLPRFAGG